MKKLFYSLFCISLLASAPSLSAVKLTDAVEISPRGTVMSKGLPTTHQYNGVPKIPMVHPYNMSSLPGDHVVLALQGKFPERLLDNSGISPVVTKGINEAMVATGVTKNDPFFVVIQSYVLNLEEADKEEYKNSLLRPMYYFSQNIDFASAEPYTEIIGLSSQIVALTGKMVITPDNPQNPTNFSVSVHNCLSKEGKVVDQKLISSGANMAVPSLTNQTYGFYGFYKATGRTVNDAPASDTRGVSVLHIMMSEQSMKQFGTIFDNFNTKLNSTVNDIVTALKPTGLAYTAGVINSMCDDAK